ncbi:MAG: type II secretion system protein [Planctomycetota bacterium]|nr:type II secretion system protein [Planctomycetota bacterium]
MNRRSIETCTALPRRGMTLLELIVAITILAVVSALAATMWEQMRSWSDENSDVGRALRVDQSLRVLERQWGSRQRIVKLDEEDEAGVWVDGEALEFVTSESILFPDWPLVHARYRIESEVAVLAGERSVHRLVLEEFRLSGAPVMDDGRTDPEGRPIAKKITLLDDCQALAWQRLVDPTRLQPVAALDSSVWFPLEPPLAGQSRESQRDERGRRETAPMKAGRLHGMREGKEFAWTFVVADSR